MKVAGVQRAIVRRCIVSNQRDGRDEEHCLQWMSHLLELPICNDATKQLTMLHFIVAQRHSKQCSPVLRGFAAAQDGTEWVAL